MAALEGSAHPGNESQGVYPHHYSNTFYGKRCKQCMQEDASNTHPMTAHSGYRSANTPKKSSSTPNVELANALGRMFSPAPSKKKKGK